MDLSQIRRLIELMAQAPIAELEIEENGRKIRLAKPRVEQGATNAAAPVMPADVTPAEAKAPLTAAAAAAAAPSVPKAAETIKAPSYGVFHLAPSPDAPPYVTLGQKVEAGQQVGLLEAMKVFNPVRADIAGTVEDILVAGGTEVDMGTPLFRLV